LFSKKDAETVNNKKNAEGEIRILGETMTWSFAVNSFGIDPLMGSNPSEEATDYLLNRDDTIMITHLNRFTDGKPGFANVASKGISLETGTRSIMSGSGKIWKSKRGLRLLPYFVC
jgi:hypothetical protein